ncbi:hypothetical protein LDL36_17370 [Komagataeibacter sp. FNDCR1]|nr:hypothetical protein [Komagataeibacter sp. FNDCR1]
MVELPRKAVDEIRNELVSIGSRSGNDVIMDAVFRVYGLPVEDDLEPNLSAFRRAAALGDNPAYQALWPEETRTALHEGLDDLLRKAIGNEDVARISDEGAAYKVVMAVKAGFSDDDIMDVVHKAGQAALSPSRPSF